MTQTGLSLGTPQYMSPEQAMGDRDIGPRSDIYSLGAVTYEMLAGDPPFIGSSAQAIVAQVITSEPRSLVSQRKSVPEYVDAAVMTALEKLPADRFASAAGFAEALGGTGESQLRNVARREVHAGLRSSTSRRGVLPWMVISGLLAILLVGSWTYRFISRAPAAASVQSSFLPPAGCAFADLAAGNLVQLTSDGASLAFTAICNGSGMLWVRSISTGQLRQLPGTADAKYYFWSPDGRSIGFFADEQLKRIDVESGAIRSLASAPHGRGGSWSGNGTIVYAPDLLGPLYQIPTDGGTPTPATKPVAARGVVVTDRNPYFLPDGRHFVYAEGTGESWSGRERVGELGDLASRQLLDVPTNVAYADGRLLYLRGGLLMAQPFDERRAELSGRPAAVVPDLQTNEFRYHGDFTVAGGMLVFRGSALVDVDLEWFDPVTKMTTMVAAHTTATGARISPDGRYVLVNRQPGSDQTSALWLLRVDGGMWSRFSATTPAHYGGLWSADGRTVATTGLTSHAIVITPVDGSKPSQLTFTRGSAQFLNDWSPDGSYILADVQGAGTGWDIERLDVRGDSVTPTPIVATAADENRERMDPSGRMIAYGSSTGGAPAQLRVARLPSGKPDVEVSESVLGNAVSFGAIAWSRDGHTLYFITPSGVLMSAQISADPNLHAGRPQAVVGAPGNLTNIDAASDGRLLLLSQLPSAPPPLTLVQNWMRLADQP
jgi:Tol biopolymer transport system component